MVGTSEARSYDRAAATLLLFVGMLVVAVRVGPWGCRKAVEERPDHEPPVTG